MAQYEVANKFSGTVLGTFEADTKEEAIEACCREAGYASKAQADDVTGRPDDLIAYEVA